MLALKMLARRFHRYRWQCAAAAVAGLIAVGVSTRLELVPGMILGLFLFGWGSGMFLVGDWFSEAPGSGSLRPQRVRPFHAVMGPASWSSGSPCRC